MAGNFLKHDREKLNKIINYKKMASVVIAEEQEDINTIHEHRKLSGMKKILNDKTLPFNPNYV